MKFAFVCLLFHAVMSDTVRYPVSKQDGRIIWFVYRFRFRIIILYPTIPCPATLEEVSALMLPSLPNFYSSLSSKKPRQKLAYMLMKPRNYYNGAIYGRQTKRKVCLSGRMLVCALRWVPPDQNRE